jgi:hypothetical protein
MWCCTLHVYNIKTYIATYILMLISGRTRPFVVADPTGIVKRGEGMYRGMRAEI